MPSAVVIRAGDREYGATVSDLSDGLGEFVTAVEQVLGGSFAGAECRWEHEPQVTSVLVRRCGGGSGAVELLIGIHDDPAWIDAAVPEFAPQFWAIVDVGDLARATVAAFELVRETYGAEGYAERWGYPFPRARLDAIAERVRREAEDDARTRHIMGLPTVLPEILCRGRTTSAELAMALGERPERVIEALRFLEGLGRFRLEERDGGVPVVAGSLWPESRFLIARICDEP
jgi:hypothetical protein